MKYLFIILCLFSCSCFGHQHIAYTYNSIDFVNTVTIKKIDIWVDKDFGSADMISIADAVEQWNYALNGYIKLNIVDTNFDMSDDILKKVMNGSGWLFLKINSQNDILKNHEGNYKTYTLAFVNDIGGNRIYVVRDRVGNEEISGLMLHEIGHLLGARHQGTGELMSAIFTWSGTRCIDQNTVEQVAIYMNIPVARMNYCVYENRFN